MFKSWVCALFLITAPFVASADDAAPPAELSASDAHAVRAVVEAQLKALAAGDAALAFSYAAPAIQGQFENAATFAAMVRGNYPMLIRPAAVSFYRPEAHDGVVIQAVQLRDGEGRAWRAVYQLQQQPDRRWRIGGCAVAPAGESSTT